MHGRQGWGLMHGRQAFAIALGAAVWCACTAGAGALAGPEAVAEIASSGADSGAQAAPALPLDAHVRDASSVETAAPFDASGAEVASLDGSAADPSAFDAGSETAATDSRTEDGPKADSTSWDANRDGNVGGDGSYGPVDGGQGDGAIDAVGGAADVSATAEVPLVVKSIGFTIGFYNPSTDTAGDIKFTRIPLNYQRLWQDFGVQDPRTTNPQKNPQPVFILPLGTKVRALVDGVVVAVTKLYSGDYTIMVARTQTSNWIYETEHVINPVVQAGDRVAGGQIIADKDHLKSVGKGNISEENINPACHCFRRNNIPSGFLGKNLEQLPDFHPF